MCLKYLVNVLFVAPSSLCQAAPKLCTMYYLPAHHMSSMLFWVAGTAAVSGELASTSGNQHPAAALNGSSKEGKSQGQKPLSRLQRAGVESPPERVAEAKETQREDLAARVHFKKTDEQVQAMDKVGGGGSEGEEGEEVEDELVAGVGQQGGGDSDDELMDYD